MRLRKPPCFRVLAVLLLFNINPHNRMRAQDLQVVPYNNPQLTVDLGVGLWAWPLPMDWDQDGDLDLVVSCPDKPYAGTYFFENPDGAVTLPVFKPGIKVGPGHKNIQVSHIAGVPRVLVSSTEYKGFLGVGFDKAQRLKIHPQDVIHQSSGNQRFNVWSYVDFDGDGLLDVMVGTDDWGFYGWDDGYDQQGNWKRGALRAAVSILRNVASNDEPKYSEPMRLQADGSDIDVYGNPMPNLADFDGDGDLDLICGEFLDGFSYFENTGTKSNPKFAARGHLSHAGQKIRMHVQMITPSAIDWDADGDIDLIVGDEDGRVALVENSGQLREGVPEFRHPQYFQQQAQDLKFGALVTPVSFDWDADGDEDLVCGNTSGNIGWFENLSGGDSPTWAAPQLVFANDQPIRIQAGENGSIQGPAEAKWGYTTLSVADWNHDGLPDLLVNSIWGKVEWFKNIGSRQDPKLEPARPVRVHWPDRPPKPSWTWWDPEPTGLATQWRTTPVVQDWNGDGLNDLVMLDHEGYLALFERIDQGGKLWLSPGRRVFAGQAYDSKHRPRPSDGELLRLNASEFGGSGRRKLCIADWDGDGRKDLLVNSTNVNWLRNVGVKDGVIHFEDQGPLSTTVLAGHTTSPTTVDWNGDGARDLVVGAEDGRLYFLKNPYSNQGAAR